MTCNVPQAVRCCQESEVTLPSLGGLLKSRMYREGIEAELPTIIKTYKLTRDTKKSDLKPSLKLNQ